VKLPVRARTPPLTLRPGTADDAEALYALIANHRAEGHLLSRNLDEIRRRASRFVVGESRGLLHACAELAPLSRSVAEVRSLVVSPTARGKGVATRLVDHLRRRALDEGFETLAAFTHDPRFFVRQNFSMVPHHWVPEKIARDCTSCPLFRRCGQHAMAVSLTRERENGAYGARDIEHVEDRRAAVA
jgi:N-acetylglutamate synthase-like GNAT family acetyltransferase